jgi:hypothetical protein
MTVDKDKKNKPKLIIGKKWWITEYPYSLDNKPKIEPNRYSYVFDYCLDGDKCFNKDDHEIAFDGQVFFKPKGQL